MYTAYADAHVRQYKVKPEERQNSPIFDVPISLDILQNSEPELFFKTFEKNSSEEPERSPPRPLPKCI